jgi:transcription elongation factor GreA
MAVETKYKMSKVRLDEIREELRYLETVREKEVSELIKEARSFGDLSENSEYDEAKTEQGKLYSKIAELRNILENAEVIEAVESTMHVALGSRVSVKCLADDEKEEYLIVGSQEANPMMGRISDDSPFGKGLIGSVVGDVVTVEAPAGAIKYEILAIQ